jgi:hypothetical protein
LHEVVVAAAADDDDNDDDDDDDGKNNNQVKYLQILITEFDFVCVVPESPSESRRDQFYTKFERDLKIMQ